MAVNEQIRENRYLTLANLVSLARAFMAIPIVMLLNRWDGHLVSFPMWAVFWIGLAVFSDFLDGWFARSYHEVSWLGKLLDPVADKVVIFSAVLFAHPIRDVIPLWFLLFMVIREVLIAGIGLWVTKDTRRELGANRTGKWTIFFTSITLLLIVFRLDPWSVYLLFASVILGCISLYFYLYVYYQYYRDLEKN